MRLAILAVSLGLVLTCSCSPARIAAPQSFDDAFEQAFILWDWEGGATEGGFWEAYPTYREYYLATVERQTY